MTHAGLIEFKSEALRFYRVLRPIVKHFNRPEYTMVSVLVQNAAHDGSLCKGYSEFTAIHEAQNIIEILKKLKSYGNGDYIFEWVYNELSMHWDGIEMNEMEELHNVAT